jgi:hypothetical protein
MTTDDAGSAPEADADSTRLSDGTTEPAPTASTSPGADRRQAARAAWRRWRRSRPFWGGLLLVLSGLELLALPLTGVLVKGQIKLVIYIGIGGVFGVLIGILLIAAGIVLWVNPTHRVFYGIAGIVLGIISFPASNLGGFVLGMLLAIIGGALAFAWVPSQPDSVDVAPPSGADDDAPEGRTDEDATEGRADDAPEGRDARDEEPSAGLDLISGTRAGSSGTRAGSSGTRAGSSGTRAEWEGTATIAEEAASDVVGPRVGDAAGHRTLAIAAMPAVLVAGLLGTGGVAKAASTQPDGSCILGIICMPSASPTPTPTPTTSAPAPGPTPTASSSSGPGSPSPTPSIGPSGTGTPAATPSTSASASPSSSGTSTGAAKSAAKGKKADPKDAAAPSGVTASGAASVLTAGSASLTDFQYLGNVCMPVSGGACEEMMEFTASSANLSGDVTVSVSQGGLTTDTSSPTLGFTGGMTLYATKLCGNIYGLVPKCFTPTTANAVLLSIANVATAIASITITDVTTDQPLTTAGTLQTGSLTVGF